MTAVAGELDWVIDLVRRESAIELDHSKAYLVEARLGPLARAAGHPDLDSWCRWARTSAGPDVRRRIVEALTTNETSWFRDRTPFEALERHIVPELLRTRRGAAPVRVWSAACSTDGTARIWAACAIISASIPSRPAVSTITMSRAARRAWSIDARATATGSPTPLPGSGAKTSTPARSPST